MNTQPSPHLSIGAVARGAGVGIDTIRYYEREGLLPEPRRRESGYRDYDRGAIGRLKFIRRAKALGFTLEDIRELLALSTDHVRGVRDVRQRAEHRLIKLEQRILALQRMQYGLKGLIANCPGQGDPDACPILRALTEDFPDER